MLIGVFYGIEKTISGTGALEYLFDALDFRFKAVNAAGMVITNM